MDEWRYSPARDLDLSSGQSLTSVRREAGLPTAILSGMRWLLVRGYLGLAHHLQIQGRHHLPHRLPLVLVANHASHLDALSLAAAMPLAMNRHMFPIAAGDTFFETKATAAFASLFMNALPMWRRQCGAHALEDLRTRLLEEPCGYIIFPEGTRSRTGRMAAFKPGVGRLVAGTPVPVVPCHLDGAFAALPPHRHWPRPARIRLRMGPPKAYPGVANDREGWRMIAQDLESAIHGLKTDSNPDS